MTLNDRLQMSLMTSENWEMRHSFSEAEFLKSIANYALRIVYKSPVDSFRFPEILSNFFSTLSFIFSQISWIPSNSSKFFQLFSDSFLFLRFVLSDYSGCFWMLSDCFTFFRIFSDSFRHRQESSRFFQIFHFT